VACPPEPPFTSASLIVHLQPAPLAATPSSAALPVPCTRQLPPATTLPTEEATPALPTAHPSEPQEGTTPEAEPRSSRTHIAGAHPLTPNVTIISPLHVISTPGHHVEGNEGVIDEPPPIQMPTPEHEDGGAPSLVPEPRAPPPPLAVLPQADDPQSQPPKRKRNWFKKMWDFIR
jgi:hypothetical protein